MRRLVRRDDDGHEETIDLDGPDPNDLGTAGDFLAENAITLLLHYDPVHDVVRIDRGTFPKTLARAVIQKAWHEEDEPETWGEEPEPDDDWG